MLIADTHVHLYDCYDLSEVFDMACNNLEELYQRNHGYSESAGTDPVMMLFLTERHGTFFFRKLKEGQLLESTDYQLESCPDESSILLRSPKGKALYLIAGRQIVTQENIEVLALTTDINDLEGKPIHNVINAIRDANGIPVLSWSLGKWFFKRGRIVKNILKQYELGEVIVGDIPLRPNIWPEPRVMRWASHKGFMVAGSDPLPFEGEERQIGTYGIIVSSTFNIQSPTTSVRQIFRNPQKRVRIEGSRNSIWHAFQRVHAMARK
ncbi:MAG: hypothetical protein GKR87_09635 [Kiritimatiellae bacterium]|nr:hypothetical protein [Kiritimatiellia bacterium]